jgi:hypothetical protein
MGCGESHPETASGARGLYATRGGSEAQTAERLPIQGDCLRPWLRNGVVDVANAQRVLRPVIGDLERFKELVTIG